MKERPRSYPVRSEGKLVSHASPSIPPPWRKSSAWWAARDGIRRAMPVGKRVAGDCGGGMDGEDDDNRWQIMDGR